MKAKVKTHGSRLAQLTRAICGVATRSAEGALQSASAFAPLTHAARITSAVRVTRAACEVAVFTAVGALGNAGAFAQQAQNAPAAPTRPFGAPSVATGAAPSGIASLGQVTVALGLVLALIFVAAWLMRRLKGFGKTGTGALDIIAELPLSQKERAVLIRVGTQQVLIGVAPGRVSTLHVLDEPVSITPPAGSSNNTGTTGASLERPTFKSLLMKSLGK